MATRILRQLLAEEIRRLPEREPHIVCHHCGLHYGTPKLPIRYQTMGCVYCLMGTIPAEQVRREYPEVFQKNAEVYDL